MAGENVEPVIARPQWVRTDEQVRRWDAAVETASALFPGERDQIWMAARSLYRSEIPT